jgi:hypothetical protein
MNFLEKLDFLMSEMSINKSKLSQISGVPYTTIDGFYKKGYENTKISTIRKIASALNVSLDYLVDDNILERNFNESGIKIPPEPPKGSTGGKVDPERLEALLIQMGYINQGEDLKESDLRFLISVGEIVRAWFAQRK